jgi:glycosyltransferase involved in cell wall biosynthesis
MKLALFTPAVMQSAIARVSRLVVRSLRSQGHEVVVVRTEDPSLFNVPTYDFEIELARWNDRAVVDELFRWSDAAIYQIGNHFPFHQGCVEWLPRVPGVACLHDYYLAHLFAAWSEKRKPEASEILRQWYGDDVIDRFFSCSNGDEFIQETWRSAPMTEWIASMATGVIVHSGWDIARLLDACPGPVYSVPLPYDLLSADGPAPPIEPRSLEDFVVLTVGHINSNKRVESVIRAIGKSGALREKALFSLVGKIEPQEAERLSALAQELGVRISISGEVAREQLREAFASADVVACLRLPALESASASAIESMLNGKAIVVLDTGFYAELPDSCVRKINAENEIAGLKAELEFLYENDEERIALGQRAAEWARDAFSADRYASELVELASSAARAAPVIAASRFFAGTLARWGAAGEKLYLSEQTLGPLAIFDKTSVR